MNEQDRLAFWTKALSLPEFRVVHECWDTPKDPICFTVIPIHEVAVCPHCQGVCHSVHRRHESARVKDLPIGPFGRRTGYPYPAVLLRSLDRFFTPHYAAIVPGAHATERFLEQAARLIRFSDIANAAGFFALPENTLARWYYDYVERQQ